MLVTGAAIGAAALGGGAIANAATSGSSTTSSSSGSSSAGASGTWHGLRGFNGPAHGTAAHEDAEKAVTGAAAAKAQAAAVKLVGSGTAGPVTTDFTGKGYETTVTKSDGSKVEVHLDSSFNAFAGPGRPGGPGGGPGGYSGYGGAPSGSPGYGA
jgi:hypothetical protein